MLVKFQTSMNQGEWQELALEDFSFHTYTSDSSNMVLTLDSCIFAIQYMYDLLVTLLFNGAIVLCYLMAQDHFQQPK